MANKKSLRKRQLQDLRGLVHSNDFKLLVPVELCCLKGGGFVGACARWKSTKVATFVESNPQMFKLLWILFHKSCIFAL